MKFDFITLANVHLNSFDANSFFLLYADVQFFWFFFF